MKKQEGAGSEEEPRGVGAMGDCGSGGTESRRKLENVVDNGGRQAGLPGSSLCTSNTCFPICKAKVGAMLPGVFLPREVGLRPSVLMCLA